MYKSRFSKDEIWQIYWLRLMGKPGKEIAKRFGISRSYVYNVFRRKAYHVAYTKAVLVTPEVATKYGPWEWRDQRSVK